VQNNRPPSPPGRLSPQRRPRSTLDQATLLRALIDHPVRTAPKLPTLLRRRLRADCDSGADNCQQPRQLAPVIASTQSAICWAVGCQWELRIGHEGLVLRKRYEILSIVNDILVAVWFVIGSILFFFASTATAGIWLFLLGSIELLIRPLIRLTRRVHIGRVGGAAGESARDF